MKTSNIFTERQEARFWAKVDKSGTCWLWLANKCKDGYGKQRIDKKDYRAHRVSWLINRGQIPQGLQVNHHCDTPGCVNPEHLFLGTQKENMSDKRIKGRSASGGCHGSHTHPERVARGDRHGSVLKPHRIAKGEEHGNAKLTPEKVNQIRDMHREGGKTQRVMAKLMGVSQATIHTVLSGRGWKHLKPSQSSR